MSDNTEKLVRMANQIAAFFAVYPAAEAVVGIRDHIAQFWTPVMRRGLYAALDAGAPGLRPEVIEAAEALRARDAAAGIAAAAPSGEVVQGAAAS